MSLHDRIISEQIQEAREELAEKLNPFVGQDWLDSCIHGLTEAKKPKDDEEKKPKAKGKKPPNGKDEEKPEDKEKAPPKGKAPKKNGNGKKKPPAEEPAGDEGASATEPAPDDPDTKAGDKPKKEAPEEEPEADDDSADDGSAEGASSTEAAGPARTSDDCKKDHATAIGTADQHAQKEKGHRAEADKQRKAVEEFADEYEEAGGKVENIDGQRHLHPPTVDDSPEVHDIYQKFDDAIMARDDADMDAIKAHREKKDARGVARRHDYEAQTGEKWKEDDHPPGHGHHHVDIKNGNGNGNGNEKNGKDKKKNVKEGLKACISELNLLEW